MTLELSMVFVTTMGTNYTNDNDENDPMPFVSIAAATANALRFLGFHKEEDVRSDESRGGNRDNQSNSSTDEKYVQQRLAELRRFERRANGGK